MGLIILRGDTIVSMTVEGPPPLDGVPRATPGGPGMAASAGRGAPAVPMAAPGLAGPVAGIGGPSIGLMAPPSIGMPPGMPPGMPRAEDRYATCRGLCWYMPVRVSSYNK